MGIDDRPPNRQPHPGSAGLRGAESLENALKMFRINAHRGLDGARHRQLSGT